MAQYHTVAKSTQLVSCPFDISHRVEAARLPTHFGKCARNHPDILVHKCPFNARHMFIKEHEFSHHVSNTCPDRVVVDRDVFHVNNRTGHFRGNLSVPPYQPRQIESEENWDEEASNSGRPGYDPTKNMNKAKYKNPVILSQMKPAEKRAYHAGVTEQQLAEQVVPVSVPGRTPAPTTRARNDSDSSQKLLKELRLPVGPPQVLREAEATKKSHVMAEDVANGLEGLNVGANNATIKAMARGRGILMAVRPPPGFVAQS